MQSLVAIWKAMPSAEGIGMRYAYGWNDILVLPGDVRAFAWSAPMRDLAAKLELSDVGLKKILTSYGIPTPPQGCQSASKKDPLSACKRDPLRRAA